jgi:hypothetical protein
VEEVKKESVKISTVELIDRFLDQLRPAITNYKVSKKRLETAA